MQTRSNRIKTAQRPSVLGLVRFAAALGLAAWALLTLGGWVRSLWALVAAPGPASADEVLLAGVAGLALVVGGWLWLGAALEGLSLLPGWVGRVLRPLSAAIVPQLARQGVALTLGVGLVGGVGGVAHAAPSQATGSIGSPIAVVQSAPSGRSATPAETAETATAETAETATAQSRPAGPSAGWRPSAPTVRPQVGPDLRSAPTPGWSSSRDGGAREDVQVVVLRGDSLWSIAAARLGPGATDEEIAAEWPRWYAANAATIGSDPNVIHPGQVLTAPPRDAR